MNQDIWPVPNANSFIDPLLSYGCEENECGSATLTADFTANQTEICITNEVTFADNSVGEVTTYAWTFEGGDPATSNEENPIVSYNDNGIYDVTLTVSNDTEENTLVMEDFITVHDITAAFEASDNDICDLEQIQFTDNSSCATSWAWTFEGGEPATSNDQNPVITYNSAGTYSVSLTVTNENGENSLTEDSFVVVHNCTGLSEYSKLEMTILPNPSTGLFQIEFSNQDYYQVNVYDIAGHLLNSHILSNANNQLDLSQLGNGVYIVNASNGSTQVKQRIIIEN